MEYSGINAKIKAMRGKLLKYSDYVALSRIKSVVELGQVLREHPVYGQVVSTIDDEHMHRELMEQKLVLSLHDDFSRIYKFVNDEKIKKFLSKFFLNNEIHTIKLLLCMIYDERDITYTMPELNELLGSKTKINIEMLKKSKTVPEFIENLKGTEFYSVLANVYNEDTPLFTLEMQLDLYYYIELWNAKDEYLDKTNIRLLERMAGSEVDLRNLTWIYRLKKYYNVQPNIIYTYLIPFSYMLKRDILVKMIEAKSIEEVREEVLKSQYGKIVTDEKYFERDFKQALAKLYYSSQKNDENSLATTLSYIYFKEVEVDNIISILEGIRYQLEPAEIMKYLILLKEEEAS